MIDERYEKLRADMNGRLDRIESRLGHMESQFTVLEERTEALQERVTGIVLYLEKGICAWYDELEDRQMLLEKSLARDIESESKSLEARISALETGVRVLREKVL